MLVTKVGIRAGYRLVPRSDLIGWYLFKFGGKLRKVNVFKFANSAQFPAKVVPADIDANQSNQSDVPALTRGHAAVWVLT